jgi:hypothetical protein
MYLLAVPGTGRVHVRSVGLGQVQVRSLQGGQWELRA